MPIFVDLFAGAGGLSLGLVRAGLEGILAVEASPMAAETYFRNLLERDPNVWRQHRALPLDEQIRGGLAVAPTSQVLQRLDVVRDLLAGHDLDVLAGGPPCQGFSTAGSRNPADHRNQLPFEFLSFVREFQPRLVLIENVPGIAARSPKNPIKDTVLARLAHSLRHIHPGYRTLAIQVNAADFGLAQRRPRVVLVAARSDIADGASRSWIAAAAGDGELVARPWQALGMPTLPTDPGTVLSALGDLGPDGYCLESADDYPAALGLARRLRFSAHDAPPAGRGEPPPSHPPNHVLRRHGERTVRRFALLLALRDLGITSEILTIPSDVEEEDLPPLVDQWVSAVPVKLPLRYRNIALASTRAELRSLILELATRKHSQRVLDASGVSGPVLSLPDDHVHHLDPRTLSVREMARLQGFPDRFVFYGRETTGGPRRRHEVPQYTQVGNAVPPPLGEALGTALLDVLDAAGIGRRALAG